MNASVATAAQLGVLKEDVRQARQKRDLYRAMMSSQSTASSERLGELTRNCVSAEDKLRRAELTPKSRSTQKPRNRPFGRS